MKEKAGTFDKRKSSTGKKEAYQGNYEGHTIAQHLHLPNEAETGSQDTLQRHQRIDRRHVGPAAGLNPQGAQTGGGT